LSRLTLTIAVLTFCAPFVLLVAGYQAIPQQVPVLRIPGSHAVALASKSIFTVFRVPLMNLIHGLMAAVMLSHASDFKIVERRNAYSGVFTTLLFTVALKSDFEALEISSRVLPALAACTVLCVIAGLALALWQSRKVPIPWPELQLKTRDKAALAGLFTLYLGIVFGSSLTSHPA
jgi:hypothetical protein